ncbi:ABC transporter ATP-binding protein [Bauldia sp.]|uniref:ABC transporter ATP-binding protein n=1 Tax=Bauldia sp. TaxID=2575872 RepID=UPI003BAA4F6E
MTILSVTAGSVPAVTAYADVVSGLISLRGVSKTFGTGADAVHAFGPVDLDIAEGEFLSLLGPSGCGKSTLMLMIAGLLPPTVGTIEMEGRSVDGPQTDIGIMFQDNTLVPWRTVRGNIELQLELRNLSVANFRDRIAMLLRSVHLEDFADRHPYELSGGMQQRAAFCQAMVHDPQIMLLDEPLGKLDAMTRESIRSDLQGLWMQQKPTVIFVTHSIEEAIQLSSRIAVVTPRPGRIDQIISIDLPFPRDFDVKNSSAFVDYERSIQEIFRGYGVI